MAWIYSTRKLSTNVLLFLGFNCRGSLSSVAILLLEGSHHLLLLQGLSLFSPLTRLLHLVSSGIGLIGKHLGPGLLCLLLVNMFHEDTLVLESVTLRFQIQFVVQMAINLLSLPVSLKQSPQHTHPLDPEPLLTSPSILSSLPVTKPSVTTFPSSFVILTHTRPGVHRYWLLDHKTILNELANILP